MTAAKASGLPPARSLPKTPLKWEEEIKCTLLLALMLHSPILSTYAWMVSSFDLLLFIKGSRAKERISVDSVLIVHFTGFALANGNREIINMKSQCPDRYFHVLIKVYHTQQASIKYLDITDIDQSQLTMLLCSKHKDTIAVFVIGPALLPNHQ